MSMDPKMIAERGAEIYATKYQKSFEAKHLGMFVAIDVGTEEAFVASAPEEAIRKGQAKNPDGVFHLIKVGSPGVYRVAHSSSGVPGGDWIFRR